MYVTSDSFFFWLKEHKMSFVITHAAKKAVNFLLRKNRSNQLKIVILH